MWFYLLQNAKMLLEFELPTFGWSGGHLTSRPDNPHLFCLMLCIILCFVWSLSESFCMSSLLSFCVQSFGMHFWSFVMISFFADLFYNFLSITGHSLPNQHNHKTSSILFKIYIMIGYVVKKNCFVLFGQAVFKNTLFYLVFKIRFVNSQIWTESKSVTFFIFKIVFIRHGMTLPYISNLHFIYLLFQFYFNILCI